MSFSSWRGVVGMVNPTMRPGMTEEVCRLLPEGIGLIPLFLNISRGTEDEFETMMPHYEKLVAVLAEQKCDLIHPNGAPPFMVHGFAGEAKIVAAWEKKYKTPIMSVAQNHVRALKAVKAKNFVGATYFPDKLNAISAELRRALVERLHEADRDPATSVVVLRAEGRSFCAGYDIAPSPARAARRGNALAWHASLTDDVALEMTPWEMAKPVIASVQGHCLGGGCELVMMCDLTVAADDALFGEPEIR